MTLSLIVSNYGDLWLALVQKMTNVTSLSNLEFWTQRHKIKRSRWCTNQFGLSDNNGSSVFKMKKADSSLLNHQTILIILISKRRHHALY